MSRRLLERQAGRRTDGQADRMEGRREAKVLVASCMFSCDRGTTTPLIIIIISIIYTLVNQDGQKCRSFLLTNHFLIETKFATFFLQFVTNGEKPGGPPRNVRITALSSDSLEVTWEDPERRLRHGPITRYNIGYREYK